METNNLLDSIAPGDIILTNQKGINFGSLPIKVANYFKRFYSERGWTHAAVYIGNGEVVEAFPKGVVRRNLTEAYLNNRFSLLILRHKNASTEKIQIAIEFYKYAKGKAYDFRALAYFLIANLTPPQLAFILDNKYFGKCFNVDDSYFCSELVSEGFRLAGIYVFEREPYKVMPIDFNNSLLFEEIGRVGLPYTENKIIHYFKKFVFNILYIFSAFVFLFIVLVIILLIALVAILVVSAIVAVIVGIIAAITAVLTSEEKVSKK